MDKLAGLFKFYELFEDYNKMKTSLKICGLVAATLVASSAFAADTPYVHSRDGQVVKSNFGLCWRTGSWTPALAEAAGLNGDGCACDADILDKAVCAAPAPVVAVAEKVTLATDTLFAFGKADLRPEAMYILDDLVSQLAGVQIEVFMATGYTDRIGSDAFNQKLSVKRAQAVAAYLESKGVPAGVIAVEGKGKAEPVVSCPNPAKGTEIASKADLVKCLAPNRRAVVEVVGTRSN